MPKRENPCPSPSMAKSIPRRGKTILQTKSPINLGSSGVWAVAGRPVEALGSYPVPPAGKPELGELHFDQGVSQRHKDPQRGLVLYSGKRSKQMPFR